LLLQSTGFNAPKAAGQAIAQLQQVAPTAWQDNAAHLALAEGVPASDVSAALQALANATAA
jgi:tryptophanyl-tRNA synthetase